jgi:hypothetical protein
MEIKIKTYHVELTKEEGRKALDLYYDYKPSQRTKSEDIVANAVFSKHYHDRSLLVHALTEEDLNAFIDFFVINGGQKKNNSV